MSLENILKLGFGCWGLVIVIGIWSHSNPSWWSRDLLCLRFVPSAWIACLLHQHKTSPKKENDFCNLWGNGNLDRTRENGGHFPRCVILGFGITFMENPLVGLLGGMELVSEQTTLQIRPHVFLPKTTSANSALLFFEDFFRAIKNRKESNTP